MKYLFETHPESGKIGRSTVLYYPEEFNTEGDQTVWDNKERSFYDALTGTWTTYDPLTLSVPTMADADVTITATASLPAGTPDNEVKFSVALGNEFETSEPVIVAVVGGEASHQFAFDTPGVYRIRVLSEHHGLAFAEVTVNEPTDE